MRERLCYKDFRAHMSRPASRSLGMKSWMSGVNASLHANLKCDTHG
jgi:hypothetical protein